MIRDLPAIALFFLILLGLVFALSAAIMIPVAYLIARPTCHDKAQKMGVRSEWGLLTDCMVEIDGRWVPLDNYRKLGER